MKILQPMTRKLSGVQNATLDKELVMDALPVDRHFHYCRAQCRNIDGQLTLGIVGFKIGASEYVMRAAKTANNGQSMTILLDMIVSGDARPFARFEGGTAGDKLEFVACAAEVELDQRGS